MKTEILYEDNSILVIRKPAGLAVQSAGIGQPDVVSELKSYLAKLPSAGRPGKGEPYLGIVHRLDQPVEGLLVFAKDKKAAATLSKQLTEGALNKHYYAVLCGYPDCPEGDLVDYLRKEGNVAVAVTGREQEFADAKIAVLHYRILEEINDPSPLALADVTIGTGRFHQIRVQFAHAGFPLLGDTKYGTAASKRGDACAEISRRGTMRVFSGACPSHFREKDGIPGSAEESGICGFCDGGIEKTHRK